MSRCRKAYEFYKTYHVHNRCAIRDRYRKAVLLQSKLRKADAEETRLLLIPDIVYGHDFFPSLMSTDNTGLHEDRISESRLGPIKSIIQIIDLTKPDEKVLIEELAHLPHHKTCRLITS